MKWYYYGNVNEPVSWCDLGNGNVGEEPNYQLSLVPLHNHSWPEVSREEFLRIWKPHEPYNRKDFNDAIMYALNRYEEWIRGIKYPPFP